MKHKTQPTNDNIGPTPERARMAKGYVHHVNFKLIEAGRDKSTESTILSDGCPLMKLHKRGTITDRQHDAGEKYYAHWYKSGLLPSTTSSYSAANVASIERSGMPATEQQADCRMRYRKASEAIGSEYTGCLSTIVLYGFEPWEYARNRFGRNHKEQARASGTDILGLALDALVSHYGL